MNPRQPNCKKRLLVLCTGNSACSQMAEGFFHTFVGDLFEVHSAGARPSGVRPEVIAVMREIGIDISGHRSKPVTELSDQNFDIVLTVCDQAREACPIFPGGPKYVHWNLDDPAAVEGNWDGRLAEFRRARDEIRRRMLEFKELFAVGTAQR